MAVLVKKLMLLCLFLMLINIVTDLIFEAAVITEPYLIAVQGAETVDV